VTIGTNAILYALDAQTGKQLYSSENLIESWAHFSEPIVAGDNVYVCTWDGKVCAFGLKK
jgi:outer membrane protein assembly factor BamB